MRNIKFRGQRQSDNEWIYGDLLQPTELCDIYEISDCESIDGSRYDVIEHTIGQYTGLHDKNGKEIYEGDIVQQFDIKENGIIKYKYGQFGINSLGMFWNIHPTKLEVIGNIYDNPDLLEKGAEDEQG